MAELRLDLVSPISTVRLVVWSTIFIAVLAIVFLLKFRLPIRAIVAYHSGERTVLTVHENELVYLHIHDLILVEPQDLTGKDLCLVEDIRKGTSDGTSNVTLHLGNRPLQAWEANNWDTNGLRLYSDEKSIFSIIFSSGGFK